MEKLWTILWTAAFLAAAGWMLAGWLERCGLVLPGKTCVSPIRRGGEPVSGGETLRVFCMALLFRAAVALLAFLLLHGLGTSLSQLPRDWIRWDALHYVNLVELGYSGYVENGEHLFLVFFPLYVWLVRPLALLIGNIPAAGMLTSFLCYAGGCCFFYRMAAEEYGKKVARRAVFYLSLFPFAFFFGGIMTESLFFLTTAGGLYAVRRHRWLEAGIWGALAALTRMHGVLLIVAAGAELMETVRPFEKRGEELKKAVWAVARRLPAVLLPLAGMAGYLALNWQVDGDPFSFVARQDHWSQGFLWFPETLRYLFRNAWSYEPASLRWDIWIPSVVLFFLFGFVLIALWRRHPSRYGLYALAGFVLNYCLSWLLSVGRYLTCLLPVFLFAAEYTEKRPRLHRVITVLLAAGFVFYLRRYLTGGMVM